MTISAMATQPGERGMIPLRRRTVLCGLGALAAGVMAPAAEAASKATKPQAVVVPDAPPAPFTFQIFRNGDAIGTHAITFDKQPDGFGVSTNIDIQVKFGFITAFSYFQTARDIWTRGILSSTEVQTLDDGKRTRLKAWTQDDRLQVSGPRGRMDVEVGTMTDLCFWNYDIVQQSFLVDTQSGEYGPVMLEEGVADPVVVNGHEVEATRYGFAASHGRKGEVWYDARKRWVKATVITRGEQLEYQLAA